MVFPTFDAQDLVSLGAALQGSKVKIAPETPGITRQLQDILDDACDIGGCENPDFFARWIALAPGSDDVPVAYQAQVFLFHDGGDWGEEDEDGHYEGIGCLFYRQDQDQASKTTVYRVHVPSLPMQDKLLAACEHFHPPLDGLSARSYHQVEDYLLTILNDESAWQVIELEQEDDD
jgi:hypothetical protein